MASIYFLHAQSALSRRAWVVHTRFLAAAFLIVLFVLGNPDTASAKPPPGADTASIHTWLREHNPQLRAMQAEAEAADARIVPAGALPDPMASVSLSGIDPGNPTFLPSNVASTRYQLRQSFPLWGKRTLSRGIARDQAQALWMEREASVLELQAQAEDAYVRYWHAEASVQVVDRVIALLEQVEEVAGVRYALGIAAQQDSIRAQVESTSMKLDRIARLGGQRESAASLNAVLGRQADAELTPPVAQPTLPMRNTDLADALAHLDTGEHPALQARTATTNAARRNVEWVRRNRFPDITLGVGSMQSGNRIESYEVMLEVEIPFQRRARREREHESRLLEEAAIARAEATRAELQGGLGVAWARWSSAREQRQLIEKTLVPQSDANFKSALASYQVGEVDFGTLLDALRQWQGADLARIDATRDELLGAAAVRALEGEMP